MRPRNILASTLFLLLLLPAAAQAQPQRPQRDMEKEQKIWKNLQIIAPDSVETFKRATGALDANNHEEAARLYAEVREEAPDFTPALRR
jgi:TolA-binding protein